MGLTGSITKRHASPYRADRDSVQFSFLHTAPNHNSHLEALKVKTLQWLVISYFQKERILTNAFIVPVVHMEPERGEMNRSRDRS